MRDVSIAQWCLPSGGPTHANQRLCQCIDRQIQSRSTLLEAMWLSRATCVLVVFSVSTSKCTDVHTHELDTIAICAV